MRTNADILMEARRQLWALQIEHAEVDRAAASAITIGRYTGGGKSFAHAVKRRAGRGADEGKINQAIQATLTEGIK
jgi:hypothetical protein